MHLDPHLDLPFAHDLVHDLVVVLVDFGLVIALLVAQDPQGLRALQLNLKLLIPLGLCRIPKYPGFGLADKIAKGIHLQGTVQVCRGDRQRHIA